MMKLFGKELLKMTTSLALQGSILLVLLQTCLGAILKKHIHLFDLHNKGSLLGLSETPDKERLLSLSDTTDTRERDFLVPPDIPDRGLLHLPDTPVRDLLALTDISDRGQSAFFDKSGRSLLDLSDTLDKGLLALSDNSDRGQPAPFAIPERSLLTHSDNPYIDKLALLDAGGIKELLPLPSGAPDKEDLLGFPGTTDKGSLLLNLSHSTEEGSFGPNSEEDTAVISEESVDYSSDWEDNDEDPPNNCNLTSAEGKRIATYQCKDGTAVTVKVERIEGENCIYSRIVTKIPGENEIRESTVNCTEAHEWMEDLLQYESLADIPDMFIISIKRKGKNYPLHISEIR